MTIDNEMTRAFRTVHEILGSERHPRPAVAKAIEATGVDPIWLAFRWSTHSGVEYIREVRLAFGLSVSVAIRFQAVRDPYERADVKVTWASGGGDVQTALAQLSHQMAWTQKAAQAEVVLRELARRYKTPAALMADLEACVAEHEAAWHTVKACLGDD
jgi:hypothetical protein